MNPRRLAMLGIAILSIGTTLTTTLAPHAAAVTTPYPGNMLVSNGLHNDGAGGCTGSFELAYDRLTIDYGHKLSATMTSGCGLIPKFTWTSPLDPLIGGQNYIVSQGTMYGLSPVKTTGVWTLQPGTQCSATYESVGPDQYWFYDSYASTETINYAACAVTAYEQFDCCTTTPQPPLGYWGQDNSWEGLQTYVAAAGDFRCTSYFSYQYQPEAASICIRVSSSTVTGYNPLPQQFQEVAAGTERQFTVGRP